MSGGFDAHVAADAALAILSELAAQRDATLNVLSLTRTLDALGIRRSRAWVDTQLFRLEELGAVRMRRVEMPGFGEVSVATLTALGRDHIEKRALLAGVSTPADIG